MTRRNTWRKLGLLRIQACQVTEVEKSYLGSFLYHGSASELAAVFVAAIHSTIATSYHASYIESNENLYTR